MVEDKNQEKERWISIGMSQAWERILDLCPVDVLRDYASDKLDLMDIDSWREQAGEARSARYDAMD